MGKGEELVGHFIIGGNDTTDKQNTNVFEAQPFYTPVKLSKFHHSKHPSFCGLAIDFDALRTDPSKPRT